MKDPIEKEVIAQNARQCLGAVHEKCRGLKKILSFIDSTVKENRPIQREATETCCLQGRWKVEDMFARCN